MVKDGYLYGLGFAIVAIVVWLTTHVLWLLIFPLLLGIFFLWFFRDPERAIPQEQGLIVSPADGLVTEADWVETDMGTRLRVSIFLNVFDVHVNRCPISGIVQVVNYRPGGFMNAAKADSVLSNEQTMVVIAGEQFEVAFKQIAGLLARRIVCNLKEGDRVVRGARMGMIKFGSRCDVLMPGSADLRVQVGTRVVGGVSILGELTGPMQAAAPDLPKGGKG